MHYKIELYSSFLAGIFLNYAFLKVSFIAEIIAIKWQCYYFLLLVKPLEDTDDADSSEVRKLRTTFSSEQIFHLEMRFEKQKYLSARERLELSKKLKLSDNQVRN